MKTLYVFRRLLNFETLTAWAIQAGIKNVLDPTSLHVTVCYSTTPLVWPSRLTDSVVIPPSGVGDFQRFDMGATVLRFDSPNLFRRHHELRARGASSDYPKYQPHVTLSHDFRGRVASLKPYSGPLFFGPEEHREIKPVALPGAVR